LCGGPFQVPLAGAKPRHSRDRIWEEAPLAGTKVTLEEKGMQSIGFDPCGNRPDEGDSLSMMRANMQGLE
jgi:hypothetical protein